MYSEKHLKDLQDGLAELNSKYEELLVGFVGRKYSSAKAQEHASQGFARRLKILKRTIENVFEKLPPERVEVPERDEVTDATINIHAFLFNVFGSLDNLAWIWVHEKGVVTDDGKPVSPMQVGLGSKCKVVRKSFHPDFVDYLKTLDRWFAGMESFRHALAHRIPLYIPPYTVDPKNLDEYRRLDRLMSEAVRRVDFAENERLSAEQMKLVKFSPLYSHSFEGKSPQVRFHYQLLADFATVHELGKRLIVELDR